jgi:hypothetical protein
LSSSIDQCARPALSETAWKKSSWPVQGSGAVQKAGKLYLPAVQKMGSAQMPPRLSPPLDETRAQTRRHLLKKEHNGVWTCSAKKGGQTVTVKVGFQSNVTQ